MHPRINCTGGGVRIVRERARFNLEKPLFTKSIRTRVLLTALSRSHPFKSEASLHTLLAEERYNYMAMKLYVGNLSFHTSSEDLQQLFSQTGTVQSASVVEDRETGRSRGFGFVEMSSTEEGQAAIGQFNGKEVGGRALTVNEAKPREDRGGSRGGGGGGRGGLGGNRGGGGGGRGGYVGDSGGGGNREPRW